MQAILELGEALRSDPGSWRERMTAFVAAHDFPLVEDQTATFFFWDEHPVDQIYLVHWVFGLESRQPLQRLEGTPAWFLSIELPHAARVEYKFEVHRGDQRSWIRDPRNAALARDPFGANSVCQMGGYTVPSWTEPAPASRRGDLDPFVLRSEVFGAPRRVTTYLPFEYKPHKRYPVMVCHDGLDYLRFASAQAVLDQLIQRYEVAPLVVAFVDPGDARNSEYAANPLQARFLVDELLPELHRRYGLSTRARDTGLMGASFGAVSSLYTAWSNPGVFGKLLLQSGSFVFTDIGHHDRGELWDPVVAFVNGFRNDPARLDAQLFLSCGVFESLIAYNRGLVPLMRRAGLDVRFVEALDGHNWINWRDRLRDGLTRLFPGHLWMTYE